MTYDREYLRVIKDVEWLRRIKSQRIFYRVYETKVAVSGNPIDSVFGEPLNPFEEAQTNRAYARFEASVLSDSGDTSYNEGGFVSGGRIRLDVSQEYAWSLGDLIMSEGIYWRVTDIDPRGLFNSKDRLVISLEKVT